MDVSSTQQLIAIIGIVGIASTVIVSLIAILNYRLEHEKTARTSRSLLSADHAAEQLARTVQRQWRDEEMHRRIHDPFPLPVRWRNAPEELFDHWSNILQAPPEELPSPLDLAGRLEGVVEAFDRIPSKRLVIFGKAGSGKTILAIRFVLDFLARRNENDPVAVIFGLESWDPVNASLQEWIINRLVQDYPGLGEPSEQESTIAADLVNAGRILPVLDGFDEIARGLHTAALTAIAATSTPLVLTSRPKEYADAVATTGILTGAAAVSLNDLTVDDLSDYLPRTTRKISVVDGRAITKWDSVISRLRVASSPEEKRVAEVLSVPLMVGLARVIYSDSKYGDPNELLSAELFPTREALEDHLLDAFVPAVYYTAPTEPRGHLRRRWSAENAQSWLEDLAVRLDQLGTRDLAWWKLRETISLPIRVIIGGIVGLVGGGLLLWPIWRSGAGFGLGAGFGIGLALIHEGRQPVRTTLRFSGRELHVMSIALGGAIGGIAGGELSGLLVGSHGFAIRFLTGSSSQGLGPVSVIGFIIAFIIGFGFARVGSLQLAGTASNPADRTKDLEWLILALKCGGIGFLSGILGGALLGLAGGLVLGTSGGLAAGLVVGLEAAVDVGTSPSPMDLLRADRANAIFLMLLFGLTVGLSVGLVVWLAVGPIRGIVLGIGSGLVDGLGIALGFTAWGQWIIVTRCGLSLTRKLPLALPRFLMDAHQRGVLRQAGAIYQFRHVRLQDHLADRATRMPRPGAPKVRP